MAKRKGKESRVIEWATKTRARTGGIPCSTCQHPEIVEVINALIRLRRKGLKTVGQRQLYERLRAEYPTFDVSFNCMRDHILKHTVGWGGKDAS